MKAIDKLKLKYLEYSQYKWPNVPDFARTYPNYISKQNSTNGLTNCIILMIKLKGWQAERINNTGRKIDNTKIVTNIIGKQKRIGSSKWIKGTGDNGTADISATILGRSVKIEVKNKKTKDSMSEDQLRYKQKVEAGGGIYYIATDFESFYKWVEQFEDNTIENKHLLW